MAQIPNEIKQDPNWARAVAISKQYAVSTYPATWVLKFINEWNVDEDILDEWEYTEDGISWWIPQGWYEVHDYCDNYEYSKITDKVVAWRKLPKPYESRKESV